MKIALKISKEKLVKCAAEVARLYRVSIQSCTQNQLSPKVQWGLCEYVIVHTILGGSPVILRISLGGKPKWLPLKFGYHDVMRTSPIAFARLNLTFFTLWTISMKLSTLVHHVPAYKMLPQIF